MGAITTSFATISSTIFEARAGVFERGGGGGFVSPYPFLIEWKISVVRGHRTNYF